MSQATDDIALALDPGHNRRLMADIYRRHGRIHIPNLLMPAAAQRLYRCLIEETPWSLVVNSGDKVFDLDPAQCAKMTAAERKALIEAAGAGAQGGFQFIYDTCRLSEAGEGYREPKHYLAELVAFLNGATFLDFMREVTGQKEIGLADAQATRYGPGHFLTQHDDHVPGKKRLAAYVLNMTPQWHADWGGLLLFLDRDGHVAEGYTPTFNALNLLRVP